MTPQPHCEHECVCGDYAIVMFDESEEKQACCAIRKCEHDTRSRPHTPAPEPERWPFHIYDDDFYEFTKWLKEHDAAIAAQAREKESLKWATALNTLIATESKRKDKESVDMVYSYRIAQTIKSLRSREVQE